MYVRDVVNDHEHNAKPTLAQDIFRPTLARNVFISLTLRMLHSLSPNCLSHRLAG
jgi:hypothetical protein